MTAHNNLLNMLAETIKNTKKQTEKQKKIAETAIISFAEKGYSNTSTAEIAKLAGVAEATIFKHYGTKENLLISIMLPFLKEFVPIMANELFREIMYDGISFEDFLRAFIKNRATFLSHNREVFQVFIKEIMYSEELKKEILPYIIESSSTHLVKIIEDFQKQDEIIDLPSWSIVKTLGTLISGLFISRLVFLNQSSICEEEIEDTILFIMQGIGK